MKKKFGNILGFIFSFAMAVALFWGMSLKTYAADAGEEGYVFYTDSEGVNPSTDGSGKTLVFKVTSTSPKCVSVKAANTSISGDVIIPSNVSDGEGNTYEVTAIYTDSKNGFKDCSELTSLFVPRTVTNVPDYAFSFCTNLTSITIEAENPPSAGGGNLFYKSKSDMTIYVPAQSVSSYKNASGWINSQRTFAAMPISTWAGLQETINSAPDATTKEIAIAGDLIADPSEEGIVIPAGKRITLDLCGYKLDRGLTAGKENGYVIKVESGAKLIITDSSTEKTGKITGGYNTSLDYCGGGVCVEGYLELQDGSITGNKAYKGGGVAAIGQAVPNLEFFAIHGGSVCNNEAVKSGDSTGFGGGVYVASTTGFNMTGGKVEKNKAAADGGGIYVDHGKSDISYGSVEYNDAEGNGGGIVNAGGTLNLINGKILNNSANGNGGGIYNGDGENDSFVSFHSSTIDGCSAKNGGGDYTTAKARFETGGGSYIKNCIATENGGAVYTENEGTSTFSNTTISGCSAKLGGALCTDGVLGIEDVTIKECVASVNGSGIYIAGQGRIFAGKTAKIYENKKGDANNNVYIADGGIITLGSGGDVPSPASGMKLGITMEKPGIFTTNGSETQTQYFVSDDADLNFKFIAADTFDGIDYDCMAFVNTVDFETNGGTDVDSRFVISNTPVSEPEAPTKEDCLFEGWYSDDEFTDEFDFSNGVTADIVLYAKWHKHNVVKVTGQQPTTTAYGWKDYYECKDSADACHEYFEDAAGKKPIADLGKWKSEGNGYIAPLDPDPDPDPAPVKSFVGRMYTNVLDRDSDPEGLENWTGLLLDGSYDGAAISYGFIMSDEFKDMELSDDDYLKTLYSTFFDREPDQEGYDMWNSMLQNGTSREEVLAGFVNSVEFTDLCDSFEISRGYMFPDGTTAGAGIMPFAERCYEKALGRKGDQAGVDSWVVLIATDQMSAEKVATDGFFHSDEFLNKNTTDEEYVNILYATFLGREADETGLAEWLQRLADGMSRDEVLYGFSRSDEFAEIMESFGI